MTSRKLAVVAVLLAIVAMAIFLVVTRPSDPTLRALPSASGEPARSSQDPQRSLVRASFQAPLPTMDANPGDKLWLDGIVLADHFAELLDRAAREPAFAYSLSDALYTCSRADSTYRNLEKRLAHPDPREHLDQRLEAAEKEFAKCSRLTAAQMAKRYELLNRAAAAGVLEAQLNYRGLAAADITNGSALRIPNRVDEIRSNVEAVTLAAARTGQKDALVNAYSFYSDGLLTEPNNVLAYRYLSDVIRLSSEPQYATLMRFLTRRMSPEELRQAQNR